MPPEEAGPVKPLCKPCTGAMRQAVAHPLAAGARVSGTLASRWTPGLSSKAHGRAQTASADLVERSRSSKTARMPVAPRRLSQSGFLALILSGSLPCKST